jgi:hypothetical protein
MRSKVIFILALTLVVCWILLFTFFDDSIYVHIVVVVALIGFIVSYFTKSKSNNQHEE